MMTPDFGSGFRFGAKKNPHIALNADTWVPEIL